MQKAKQNMMRILTVDVWSDVTIANVVTEKGNVLSRP